jgi:hypothetical protein
MAALSGSRKGGALEVAEKRSTADYHPGAWRATPPESGGELRKKLPSSVEEGWRAKRRGGADKQIKMVVLMMIPPHNYSASCFAPPKSLILPLSCRWGRTLFLS